MTKDEAEVQVGLGRKVTNRFWSQNEWISSKDEVILNDEGCSYGDESEYFKNLCELFDEGWSIWKPINEEQTFINYIEQARKEFAEVASKYGVKEHNELRTAIDSILIAYDQMAAKLNCGVFPKTNGIVQHLRDVVKIAETIKKHGAEKGMEILMKEQQKRDDYKIGGFIWDGGGENYLNNKDCKGVLNFKGGEDIRLIKSYWDNRIPVFSEGTVTIRKVEDEKTIRDILIEYDKSCEEYTTEDISLSSEELVDRFLKNKKTNN